MGHDLGIIDKVFEESLDADEFQRILETIKSADRQSLVAKMEDMLQRAAHLVDVSRTVSDSLSLDLLLPRLMEFVTEALNADRSSLFLFDAETGELFSRVAQGDSVGEIRMQSDIGVAGAVFQSGVSEIIDDAYADPRFNADVDRETGYHTRDLLCAPLRNTNAEVIGVTQVLNRREGHFTEEDRALLERLTSYAASALANAHTFERVQRARQEEARMLEMTSAISSELQLDALLAKIVGVTTEVLGADRSTLFIYEEDTNELWSQVAEGVTIKEIRFPSTAGIAGTCFTTGEAINIPDAYADDRFNRAVDKTTGYRTRNILCMPVVTKQGRKMGLLQVLNKKHGPFTNADENRLRTFAAQVSIALENARLFEEVLTARNYNESILRSLSNGVITLDAERCVTKINQAAGRIFQLAPEQVLAQPLAQVLHTEDGWILQSIDKVTRTHQLDLNMDSDLHFEGGAVVAVNLGVAPLIDGKEEFIGYVLIAEDISSEKRVKSTMARYMAKEVVDKLLEEGEHVLGGTSQEVTVLFSDIRGFTPMSERLGARQAVSMLNEYFSEMVEVIFAHSGILDKYIGDAIMALFGAPFQSPQDPENAVAVANHMMTALCALNQHRAELEQEPIRIGIGINTGEVVAGNIGSPKRMEYTVIGDTVNVAARLESANKHYGTRILLSEFTLQRLKTLPRLREIDLVRLKGKGAPLSIFEVLDYHTAATFPEIDEALRRFANGLQLYRNRDWERAGTAFGSVLELRPDDSPAQLYRQRCRHFAENPPKDDWDGATTLDQK